MCIRLGVLIFCEKLFFLTLSMQIILTRDNEVSKDKHIHL